MSHEFFMIIRYTIVPNTFEDGILRIFIGVGTYPNKNHETI